MDKLIKQAITALISTSHKKRVKTDDKYNIINTSLKVYNILFKTSRAHNGMRLPKRRRV